jgi:hypothetical protein
MRTLSVRCTIRLSAFACAVLFLAAPNPAQSFKNPLIIPTTTNITAIATGDLNHDGKPDLVYTDGPQFGQQTIHILLGTGRGTFSHGQDTLLPAGTCCGITVADVTGDGVLDLVLMGAQTTNPQITVLVGNGDGTFQTPILSTFQEPLVDIFVRFNALIGVGDVNGDGKVDVVANDGMNGILDVLLGDGTGRFTLGSATRTFLMSAVFLADLNGDHHLDIVCTDQSGNDFGVFLGNGDGTFQPVVHYNGGSGILVDLDGDGHPDMVVENFPSAMGIFKGNPDGTFAPLSSLGTALSPSVLTVAADLNSDALPDLIFATPNGIGVELDTGSLVFSPMNLTVSGSMNANLAAFNSVVADFNLDGHADIAMAVEGGIAILLGKGDGTFASADLYDMGQQVGSVAIADFTGDKLPDIAVTVAGTFPRILVGDGKGGFTLGPNPNTSTTPQGPASNIFAADFNGDGKSDVTFGTAPPGSPSFGTQFVALGNGNGTFSAPVTPSGVSPTVADFNKDGLSDMISIAGETVTVLLGQANGSFNAVTTTLRNGATFFNVGDVNNDGKPDLVLNYSDHLEIWLGNGDGTFAFFGSVNNQGTGFAGVEAITDVDGDGNADIVFGPNPQAEGAAPEFDVFYGNGDGTFQPPVSFPVSHAYTQVIAVDLNNDKKPDLVMTDGVSVVVMMNLGGRQFGPETYFVAGQAVSFLSIADVNGDGFPDIVAANPGGTTVAVLLNQPNGNSLEGAPTSGNLQFAPEPSVAGSPFTATLTVSEVGTGLPVPTGSATFSVDGVFVASAPLVNGVAINNFTETLIPIIHTITTTYSGDAVYAPANFAAVHSVIAPVYPTQTALVASPSAILDSQTVHLVATVTSTPSSPGGIVTFYDGSIPIGASTIDMQGVAIRDTALLSVGSHNITAAFQGFTQPGFNPNSTSFAAAIFSPSTSSILIVTVTSNVTASTLSTSSSSLTAGTVVTLTFKATSPAGVPFGGATFFDGNSVLGTLGLEADGSASFSTASLSKGSHSVTAAFNANGPFAGSTSAPVTISVSAAPVESIATIVSLAEQTNSTDGSQILIASVVATQGSPAGIVTFLDNGVILASAQIDASGMATSSVGILSSGIHNLTASFAGEPEFAPAVSPLIQDQWPQTGPGFSLNVGTRTLELESQGSDPLRLAITPLGSFAQQVQLTCVAGVPATYACEFSPDTLAGGGASTLTLRSQASMTHSSPEFLPLFAIVIGLVSTVLVVAKRRRPARLFFASTACCALAALAGCGATVPPSNGTQIVVLTIQASSGAGSTQIIHSAQVAVKLPR